MYGVWQTHEARQAALAAIKEERTADLARQHQWLIKLQDQQQVSYSRSTNLDILSPSLSTLISKLYPLDLLEDAPLDCSGLSASCSSLGASRSSLSASLASRCGIRDLARQHQWLLRLQEQQQVNPE